MSLHNLVRGPKPSVCLKHVLLPEGLQKLHDGDWALAAALSKATLRPFVWQVAQVAATISAIIVLSLPPSLDVETILSPC